MGKPSVLAELPNSVTLVDGAGGLPLLSVSTPTAAGEVYFHGAHVAGWTPAGNDPVIWMSKGSAFAPAEPIRGGVPICFPWFGPGRRGGMSPLHGFAGLADWSLVGAEDAGGEVTLTFRLTEADVAGLPGVEDGENPFELSYTVRFGAELALALTVRNPGDTEYSFEEALHTYFAVKDIRRVTIDGLDGAPLLDRAPHTGTDLALQVGPVVFTRETDRVYASMAPLDIIDPAARRVIRVVKEGSGNTVVWNPWIDKAAAMPDFGDDEWQNMVCVETANVLHHTVVLGAGDRHTMSTRYGVISAPRGAR
jgi:glucose-6-phosphate 1-epimerase